MENSIRILLVVALIARRERGGMSRILLHFNPPVTMLHAWLVRSSGLFIRERSLALRGLLLIRTRRGMPLRSEGRWHFNLATFSSHVQMLPFEIGEQLNLTLARPYISRLSYLESANVTALLTFRISLYLTATRIPLQIPPTSNLIYPHAYLLSNCLLLLSRIETNNAK